MLTNNYDSNCFMIVIALFCSIKYGEVAIVTIFVFCISCLIICISSEVISLPTQKSISISTILAQSSMLESQSFFKA